MAGNISLGIRRKAKVAGAANITKKEVNMAIKLAEKNASFEVVYYPTVGGFDFVVGAKTVEDAVKVNWSRRMRVTHMVKNDDTPKGISIFHGTISNLESPSTRPWRMLRVEWDDPQVPENLKQLSPWQVEVIDSNTPLPDIEFPTTKILRGAQGSVLSTEQIISNPPHTSGIFPNIMQGSMHNLASTSSNYNTKKTSPGSIMLFGQRIQPIESDLNDSHINGDNGCKKNNEV